ncbi:hypothetical protein [Brumicola nitratireducens]|uniref:Uncharacterized protein n=1 Tax=Glaciecola nitratireducens (strain JCM 12485 / KCTC 12276 / FR1064) TaxID=1085623 RepID=G4QKZ4_GLANF|nr:hypothetical protein [Glaciecola nitratireducens]AEP29384.1 hypothetical protein GNIT_1260 [Glaciecola nitratireducens FR1064]
MQLKQTNIQLRDAKRYLTLKGHYRLLDVKMYDHYLADFEFIITVSDGDTELKLSTFKPVRLPLGGFVYVEASFKDNGVGGYWDLHNVRLSSIEEALHCCGFEVDAAQQQGTKIMPLPSQIKQITDVSLVKIKDMFIQGYSKQKEIERCYSFYDAILLRESLSWLFSVKFESDKQRDYAAVGAMLWMGFKHYIDPNYKLTAGVDDMQEYRDFLEQGIATLSKFDEDLANYFERIMNENLMLNLDGSLLNECSITQALQIVYFHGVTVPNFYEEKRYG